MKLTTKSEYACLALLELAESYEGRLTIGEIANKRDIPKKYLESILLQLKRNGYLQSRRGPTGGYKLAKHPSEIDIAEIVRLMDGPIAPVSSVSEHYHNSSPIEASDRLTNLFSEIRNMVAQKLESVTLQDLKEKEGCSSEGKKK